MVWHPQYRLYANDGLTLVYTFNFITAENSPQDPFQYTEIIGFRGQGSVIVPGSTTAWDLELEFYLCGTNYQDTISKMDSMETTIVKNTEYILKIDRTPSTSKDYNVKRIIPIRWEQGLRNRSQKGSIIFRVGAW